MKTNMKKPHKWTPYRKLPYITTNHPNNPMVKDIIEDIITDTNKAINNPDSPFDKVLKINLQQVVYMADWEDKGELFIDLVFAINNPKINDEATIKDYAEKAFRDNPTIPNVLNYILDIPFGEFSYQVTDKPATIIFKAFFPIP